MMRAPIATMSFLIASISTTQAQTAPAPFKICTTSWVPSTICHAETKEVTGKDTQRIRDIMTKLGKTASIECLPWVRCLRGVETGEYDAAYAVSKTPARAKYLLYPQKPLLSVSYVFVTLQETPTKWDNRRRIQDVPAPISAPFGWSATDQLLQEKPKPEVDTSAADDESNLRKLLAQRAKTILIEEDSIKDLASSQAISKQIKILHPPYQARKNYFIGISKRHGGSEKAARALVEELDKQL